MKWFSRWSVLFPGACVLCARPVSSSVDLCPRCAAQLPRVQRACYFCAAEISPLALRCPHCQAGGRWPLARCLALLRYVPPATGLIVDFKYHDKLSVGRSLSLLLAREIRRAYRGQRLPEAIVPMPLHWRRLCGRGFNQSQEIARVLSSALGLPVDRRHCSRRRPTAPQVGLDERRRFDNLRSAFACDARFPWRRVALVDDVMTTGATVCALAELLVARGAEVHFWCLARASPPGASDSETPAAKEKTPRAGKGEGNNKDKGGDKPAPRCRPAGKNGRGGGEKRLWQSRKRL